MLERISESENINDAFGCILLLASLFSGFTDGLTFLFFFALLQRTIHGYFCASFFVLNQALWLIGWH
jgi:hypothetical protein